MKLKWSLVELAKYRNQPLVVNGKVDLTNSLKNRKEDLLDATAVQVSGVISSESMDRFIVDLTLDVVLTLPSTRSLTPVDFALSVPMTELYIAPSLGHEALNQDAEDDLDNTIVVFLEQDFLDLKKPIEDTILASIPMKILSETEEENSDERPSGDDWELVLEDEILTDSSEESEEAANNPFGVLKDLDLFNEEDKED